MLKTIQQQTMQHEVQILERHLPQQKLNTLTLDKKMTK